MHDDPKEGQGGFQAAPFLEAVDRWTKCDFALALQNKGSSTTSTVRAFGKFVESLGDRRTTNKSDGEPVIVLLKTNAAGITGIRAVPVGSPVGDHAANGKVENYIRETKGRKRDAERRMHYGRYVGHHNRHGSVMVFTSTGLKIGSSYTRRQDGRGNRQAWQTDGWTELRGLLWDIQPIPPRNTFPVQSRYVEKYGKTIGGDGCIWLISGVGQQPAHNAECRAFIVSRMLEDAYASTAARQQVDSCYSREAQDPIRTQSKRHAEQAAEQATEPLAMQTETTTTTGAGKLPAQKRKAADKEAEDDVVGEFQVHGQSSSGGSNGSGLQAQTQPMASSHRNKRAADNDAEDLSLKTTDFEQLMEKVVIDEPKPEASETIGDTPTPSATADPATQAPVNMAPSGNANFAESLDLCLVDRV